MTDRHLPSSTSVGETGADAPAAAVAGEVGRWAVTELCIAEDDPTRGDARYLAGRHLDFANRHSTPEDVHALGPDEPSDPGRSSASEPATARCSGLGRCGSSTQTAGS